MNGTQSQLPNPWGSILNANLQPVDSIPGTKWHKLSGLSRIIQQQHIPYAEPTQVSKGLTEIASGGTQILQGYFQVAQGGTLATYDVTQNVNITVIDQLGVVSTGVFQNDEITDNTVHTTTSTSPTLVSGATLNSFVLQRSVNVLINVFASGRNENYVSDSSFMQLSVIDSGNGGTPVSFPMACLYRITGFTQGGGGTITGYSTHNDSLVADSLVMIQMSAGTHTLSLYQNVDGTGTAHLDLYQLSYVVLGQ